MYINTTSGRKFSVEVDNETTLHSLKLKIMDEMGAPPQHQKITFGGRTLGDDNASLLSFGLDPLNSEVDLIPVLHGGCGCECCGVGCKCTIL